MVDMGFRHLIQLSFPRYTIPDRPTFGRCVLPALFEACREEDEGGIGQGRGACCPFHIGHLEWPWRTACLPVTHWTLMEHAVVEESGEEKQEWRSARLQVHAQVLDSTHTAANILEALEAMLTESWPEGDTTTFTRSFIVMDSRVNTLKALHDGDFVGVHCLAHILHLVVRDGPVFSQPSGRTIAGHFN